jgi:hypothetical protein
MQGEVAAYLLREALGALLKLGGEKPFDLKQSAQRVVHLYERTIEVVGSLFGLPFNRGREAPALASRR